ELLREEGIALREVEEAVDEGVRELRAPDQRLEGGAGVGGREGPEDEGREAPGAAEAGEGAGHGVALVDLRGAGRADDEGRGGGGRTMYWSASMERSAPCRSSSISTSGLPAAMRVRARASSSNTWVRSSGTAGAGCGFASPATCRSPLISFSIGKRETRSGAR